MPRPSAAKVGTAFANAAATAAEPPVARAARSLGLVLMLAFGCATSSATQPSSSSSSSASSSTDLAAIGGRSPSPERRLAEWKDLQERLKPVYQRCGGVRATLDDERTGVVFSAQCLFEGDAPAVSPQARSLVAKLAEAFRAHPNRDHWIGVYAARGAADPWRLTTQRASAIVAALVAAGVPAERLAAVTLGDVGEKGRYNGPPELAPGRALVEITVVAGSDEQGGPPR